MHTRLKPVQFFLKLKELRIQSIDTSSIDRTNEIPAAYLPGGTAKRRLVIASLHKKVDAELTMFFVVGHVLLICWYCFVAFVN